MARLDGVIEKLLQSAGSEVTFQTGEAAILKREGGDLPVIRTTLSTRQIVGAFGEIAPPELLNAFPPPGVSRFLYRSPSGSVQIRFENLGEAVRASITAVPQDSAAEEGGIELASPADMLGMAAQHAGLAPAEPQAAQPPPVQEKPRVVVAPKLDGDPRVTMDQLLNIMLDRRASDLHLSSQTTPMARIDGDITHLEGWPPLSADKLKAMLWSIAPARNQEEWEQRKDTDFAYETDRARFRCNVFMDRKGIGTVLRQIPNNIKTAEEMGLSQHILDLCYLTKGLVLVTGPTGSGKSTTLAAMIDHINKNREDHIITIEDPIEFVHQNQKCLVNQREINVHTQSFKNALRAALREDPDIVLVGELRDLETISIAIETAETGHLVFGTLHTNTAPSTVDRIIDQFPPDRQAQIRTMLSESLKGVISQTLCKKIGGGRAAAQEVLIVTGSVSNLIREGKTFQIQSVMQTGRNVGMVTLNDALFDLVKRKLVEPQDAYVKAVAKAEFKNVLERGGFKIELAEQK